jgi:hypothetical protein
MNMWRGFVNYINRRFQYFTCHFVGWPYLKAEEKDHEHFRVDPLDCGVTNAVRRRRVLLESPRIMT